MKLTLILLAMFTLTTIAKADPFDEELQAIRSERESIQDQRRQLARLTAEHDERLSAALDTLLVREQQVEKLRGQVVLPTPVPDGTR